MKINEFDWNIKKIISKIKLYALLLKNHYNKFD